jgi:hypothetical protein
MMMAALSSNAIGEFISYSSVSEFFVTYRVELIDV